MDDVFFKDKKLLIVDDESDLREIIASEFEFLGARVFQAENVKSAQSVLAKNKIDTAIHYPTPIHLQKAYKDLFGKINLPNTTKYSKEILSLPINPFMKKKEIDYVIKKIKEFFETK
jgi:dTDP-4-amino-4,6-dideoxygalactose transaminase